MRTLALLLAAALCSGAAEFTTYIGDSNDYRVARVVADAAGNTYIAGSRFLLQVNEFFIPYIDSFVMKLDPTGKIVLFTVFSGKGDDSINDLAIDSVGNIYVAGSTSSVNFPLHNAFQSTPGPGFIVKFNPDATQIIFSTYFPGSINGLAVDPAGNVYVGGSTSLSTFPVTAGLPAGQVGLQTVPIVFGAFLTKIAATGDKILYSTVIAGHGKDCGAGSSCFLSTRSTSGVAVAVDAAGEAYLAGNTDTNDLPTTIGAFLTKGTGAFVAKVNATGTALAYLTLIGDTNYIFTPFSNPANTVFGLAVDAAGNAYLAGSTTDPNFPATAGAYQPTFNGPSKPPVYPAPASDAFVAKLNPAGSAMVWATFLGGKDMDQANAVAVDGIGNVWVTGTTASADFPNAQGWSQGGDFVAGLNAAGATLTYAARYPNDTVARTIAVDASGTLHVAGPSGMISTIAPAKPTMRIFGIGNAAYGLVNGRIVGGELISIYGPHIGPPTPATGTPDGSGAFPTSLAGVQVFVNDAAIRLLYVSDTQINAAVPYVLGGSLPVQIRLASNGTNSPNFPAALVSSDPQVFQNADGTAKAVNQDGTINSSDHPAKAGSIVSIWATGLGALYLDPTTMGPAIIGCQVYESQSPLNVLFCGQAPGLIAGVDQINFQLPMTTTGRYITLSAAGRSSSPVQIYVQL
jgi:uncharacterized protein (TIGR03437 family)